MFFNNKMKPYLDKVVSINTTNLEYLAFAKLSDGYFFEREINENVKIVVEAYESNLSSDWAGFEYGTNKIHLEDFIEGSVQDITVLGISLVTQLADRFKKQFENLSPVFWLGSDEFADLPSVTLGFYVKREGMVPLLPEDQISLDKFANALLIVV